MTQAQHAHGLTARDIHLGFGGVKVLKDVSVSFKPGHVTGLIGPNGAGKTSFFNCLTGHYRNDSGEISLDGVALNGVAPPSRARLGIARTFQHVALSPELSVVENVMFGLHASRKSGLMDAFVPLPGSLSDRDESRTKAVGALAAVGLEAIADEPAHVVAPGTLRLVELARAMVGKPRALLLDEPAAGLNSSETRELIETLQRIAAPDLVMVVVEHDMELIMKICDVIHVLNFGALIASGTPEEIRSNKLVAEVYLGAADD
ncbi:MAG TPA: ABC transporter ATP-binding protein [Bosea sp. (in: a-proteobacteria)]|jgi:branched-chain amino acid transport system ATP-binding protein|uniref:ABC transporter ATP-binding protein n=1 Tax=Bosea sp. (in: a-proteobacteria) TaxID=1871050 RepID=UPI002E141461|nr:ABC transporter ATP-binding protein [Bosea sp. (in: a-proteobacteria)]